MMMPHETQEMLTLLREINETLKAMLADKPGQGPQVQPPEEDETKSRRK